MLVTEEMAGFPSRMMHIQIMIMFCVISRFHQEMGDGEVTMDAGLHKTPRIVTENDGWISGCFIE